MPDLDRETSTNTKNKDIQVMEVSLLLLNKICPKRDRMIKLDNVV